MVSPVHKAEDSLTPVLEEVLDDCLKLLLLRGYDNATMEELASAAGKSKDFILTHFATKKQFCAAALRWHFSRNIRQLGAVLALHSELFSAVEAILYEYIELVTEQRREGKGILFHSLLDFCRLDEDLNHEFEEIKREAIQRFTYRFVERKAELKYPEQAAGLAGLYVLMLESLAVQARAGMPTNYLYQAADYSLVVLSKYMKH